MMNKFDIFKKMLPGLLPIIIYIAADEYFGTEIGITVALIFGLAELLYFYLKEHRIDKFIIIDTALLIALGGISIILDDARFFKLKPALIELIFSIILGVSVFSENNIILSMSKRYMKDVTLNEQAERKMKQNIKVMFWIFILHAGLIIYAAYFMSDKAWGFISTALLYIILAGYFVFEFIRIKRKSKQTS